jgi:hypothetical protein
MKRASDANKNNNKAKEKHISKIFILCDDLEKLKNEKKMIIKKNKSFKQKKSLFCMVNKFLHTMQICFCIQNLIHKKKNITLDNNNLALTLRTRFSMVMLILCMYIAVASDLTEGSLYISNHIRTV